MARLRNFDAVTTVTSQNGITLDNSLLVFIQSEALLQWLGPLGPRPHLSPGVSLIYDRVHDSGILQSELFTSRSQNLVLAKLPNSGFWRYGQFFK